MRIARLELRGFKSFPDRTVFEFGPGVSCVVGPNGSGKSNVVDALRWVIGEQSPRSLRASDMADVIFAGSTDRAPVGFAEVALALSSDRGEPFPGEYAALLELGVCRRLHRSGASEYLINGVRARRRDILELFLDTGIGNNLYSFIEQGQIDKLIHASPEERRSLIDEAAGISRYKARRAEALERLSLTGAQLDRAADLADEMARRLGALEKQVLAAANFRRLRALLRQDEVLLSLVKYADAVDERRAVRDRARQLDAEVQRAGRAVAAADEALGLRRAEVEVAEAAANLRRDEVADLEARRRELEGARGFHERRRSELTDREVRLAGSVSAALADRQAAAIELEAHEPGIAASQRAEEAAQQAVLGARRASAEAAAARQASRQASVAAQVRLAERGRTLAHAQAAESALRGRVAAIPGSAGRLSDLVAASQGRLSAVNARLLLLGAGLRERAARVAAADEAVVAARAEGVAAGHAAAGERARLAAGEVAAAAARAAALSSVRAAEATVERARTRVASDERDAAARVAQWLGASRALSAEERDAGISAGRQREEAIRASWAGRITATERSFEAVDAAADAAALERWRVAESDGRSRVARLEAELVHAVRAAESAEESAGAARLAAAEAEAEGWVSAVDAARLAHAEALGAAARAQAELAAAQGALAALVQLAADEAGRVAGVEELAATLADARPLSQRVAWSEEEAASLGPIVGDRLGLPVAERVEEVLAAAQRVRGRVSLLLAPGDPVDTVLRPYALVDDLASALALWRAEGRGAIVRGSGERIGPDGVAEIGPLGDAAARMSARGLAEAPARVAMAEAALAAAKDRCTAAESQLAAASGKAEAARAAVRGVEADLRQRIAAAGEEARGLLAGGVTQARAESVALLGDLERGREAERSARRAAHASALERASRESAEVILACRVVEAEVLERLRQASAERETAAARQAEAGLAAVHSAGAAALDEVGAHLAAARAAAEGAEVKARDELAALRAAAEAARALEAGADRAEAVARAEHQARSSELQLLERDIVAAGTEREAAHLRIVELEGERLVLSSEEAELSRDLGSAVASAARAALSVHEAQDEATRGQLALEQAEQTENDAGATLRAAEVAQAEARERARAAEASVAADQRRVEETDTRLEIARTELLATEVALADAGAERLRCVVETSAVDEARAAALDRLAGERERVGRVRTALKDAEEGARVAEAEREARRHALAEDTALLERVSAEVDTVRRRIEERYQLSLSALLDRVYAGGVELAPDDAVREGIDVGGRRVAGVESAWIRPSDLGDTERVASAVAAMEQHRAELAALGEVNLGALVEYAELRDRHSELAAQRADLEESVATLRAAIARMNRECRQRFREAFDRVNENFQVVYPRLVGGGVARLALTNEEDLLEAGVEIFVQPPGKRLQNLNLLSGGEKAMTAIALLISLFQVKPSPFCILDEVDAPLDEANGGRFNDMLREMSASSQFIVVTHNRKTMECADALFGVTMARPGVSRLVSVEI